MRELKPSAAALYWFLKANGETEYKNQQELAQQVRIPYGTLKDAIKELRRLGLLSHSQRSMRLYEIAQPPKD